MSLSPISEVLVEESLLGWKEYEMEVIRDNQDNCIIVCSIENIDPMGVHTGDSITVAPSLTLTDKEFQKMRNYSIDVIREIGVDTGGANVQFAANPKTGRMVVIEMNLGYLDPQHLLLKLQDFQLQELQQNLPLDIHLMS